jgi:hypothetical protein
MGHIQAAFCAAFVGPTPRDVFYGTSLHPSAY